MSLDLVIVDYGMGNLRSVQKAVESIGQQALISGDPKRISSAKALILPGVGAFGDGMANMQSKGIQEVVLEHLSQGKPLLGICLGMQLLFETGHEDGKQNGLGWFGGEVVRFSPIQGIKIPHMGWNRIRYPEAKKTFGNVSDGSYFYFVHAFHVQPSDNDIIGTITHHGIPFVSSVRKGKVLATQFHPEKSQKLGAELLRFFVEEIAELKISTSQGIKE